MTVHKLSLPSTISLKQKKSHKDATGAVRRNGSVSHRSSPAHRCGKDQVRGHLFLLSGKKLANIRNVENMSLPFSPKILQPASNDFTTLMKLDQQDGISQAPPMGQSGDRVA